MDKLILQYMAWGYEILPNGNIRDPYSGAIVDTVDLAGISLSLIERELSLIGMPA